MVAGLVILLTGWAPIDPLLSLGIAALVAWSAVRIVLETVDVLLETTPRDIDVDQVTAEIESTAQVDSVRDLHVWSLSPDNVALSCHLVLRTIPRRQRAFGAGAREPAAEAFRGGSRDHPGGDVPPVRARGSKLRGVRSAAATDRTVRSP